MNVNTLKKLDSTIRIVTVFLLPPWFSNIMTWTLTGMIHWIFLVMWAALIIGGFVIRYKVIAPRIYRYGVR